MLVAMRDSNERASRLLRSLANEVAATVRCFDPDAVAGMRETMMLSTRPVSGSCFTSCHYTCGLCHRLLPGDNPDKFPEEATLLRRAARIRDWVSQSVEAASKLRGDASSLGEALSQRDKALAVRARTAVVLQNHLALTGVPSHTLSLTPGSSTRG